MSDAATTERQLPPGWDDTHLEAYREGFTDALQWALRFDPDPEDIKRVLEIER